MSKIAIIKKCETCGNDFELNPKLGINWAKKTGRGKYCSRKCYWQARKGIRVSKDTEFKKGNRGNYKDGLWSYRKYVKDRCEDCLSNENLQVHHLDKNRRNNGLDNLRTLCRKCHWTYHKGRIPWNKGLKLPSLSLEHKRKIAEGVRRYYVTN